MAPPKLQPKIQAEYIAVVTICGGFSRGGYHIYIYNYIYINMYMYSNESKQSCLTNCPSPPVDIDASPKEAEAMSAMGPMGAMAGGPSPDAKTSEVSSLIIFYYQ